MSRRGFALIAVLWMLTVLASVTALAFKSAGLGQAATTNRLITTRARWAAEACLAIAEARNAAGGLADTGTVPLGRGVACAWRVDYPDASLDLNTAAAEALTALAERTGATPEAARRFADAVTQGRGAGPWTDVGQVPLPPDLAPAILPWLTVDGSGQVDAQRASPVVLGSLTGMSPEAVTCLVLRQESGRPMASLDELSGELSPAGREVLRRGYRELAPRLAFGSGRVAIMLRGWVAFYGPYPSVTIEVVGQRLSRRLAILRRRML